MEYLARRHGNLVMQQPMYNSSHHIKAAAGRMLRLIEGRPHAAGDLLVFNLHSTPERWMPKFDRWLRRLQKGYTLYSPDVFEAFYAENGSLPNPDKPGVVFTFDDGLRNNRHALEVLEKYGVRGLLFVVPDFYRCPRREQEDYYRKHIRQQPHPGLDGGEEEVQALSAEELRYWAERGHTLGAHSFSHTMRANDLEDKIQRETTAAIEAIAADTGSRPQHFCAPFDSLFSTSRRHMDVLKQHVRFYHSTFPGSNSMDANPLFIRRVNIELFWKAGAIDFACSRLEWKRWRAQREAFNQRMFFNQV
jgi:peptidoglycan/xylan/chitin deacetylase (PgdA/CDA1 family)